VNSVIRNTGIAAALSLSLFCTGPAALAEVAGKNEASTTQLRQDVTTAEKKFLVLYNRLNKNRKYAISCRDEANTGSRLSKRSCSSRAEDAARAEQARAFLGAIDVNASLNSTAADNAAVAASAVNPTTPQSAQTSAPEVTTGDSSSAASDAEVAGAAEDTRSQFNQNLEVLMDEHPDLRKLMDEYLEARRRLEVRSSRR
jgi:hypothetical protein